MNTSGPIIRTGGVCARRVAVCCAWGFICLLALPGPAIRAGEKPPAPAAKAETVALSRTYQPGDYEFRHEAIFTKPDQFKSVMVMGLAVEKAADGNGIEVRIRVGRKLTEEKDPAKSETKVWDTDKPETCADREEFLVVTKCEVKLILSTEGRLLRTSGGDALTHAKFPAYMTEEEKKGFSKKTEQHLAQQACELFAYFPPGPVSLGAQWKMHRKITGPNIPADANFIEDSNCVLDRFENEGDDKVAVITIEGVREFTLQTRVTNHAEIKGNVRVRLHGNRIIEQVISVEGWMKAGDGQGRETYSSELHFTLDRKHAPETQPAYKADKTD